MIVILHAFKKDNRTEKKLINKPNTAGLRDRFVDLIILIEFVTFVFLYCILSKTQTQSNYYREASLLAP